MVEEQTKEPEPEVYHVKGYWSVEGIFNGAIYCNNHKFGTCVRVSSNMISVTASVGKDDQYKRFKQYLIRNRLKRHVFLTEKIGEYMEENPDKRIKLV